jgi:hypothetical protein
VAEPIDQATDVLWPATAPQAIRTSIPRAMVDALMGRAFPLENLSTNQSASLFGWINTTEEKGAIHIDFLLNNRR